MEYTSQEEKLAIEIAEALDDVKSLKTHLLFAKQYSESFLREKLEIVLKTPKEDIRKSRAAYYTYLVTQHAIYRKHYPRG